MIDIHNHILFGVDDGAENVEDSMNLIKEEVAKGVSHIILTPHLKHKTNYFPDKIIHNFNELKENVIKERIDIKLYLGNEIYVDSDFYDILETREFNTLAGSDYILIEFSLTNTPENIAEICYEIKIKGYMPIIAHVERYSVFYGNEQLLKDVLAEGALLQVNASTVINKEGKESKKFADNLLKRGLVSFIASDVHNTTSRKFFLDKAYHKVSKVCGKEYAEKIFRLNQLKIIENMSIEISNLENEFNRNMRRSILSKIFK